MLRSPFDRVRQLIFTLTILTTFGLGVAAPAIAGSSAVIAFSETFDQATPPFGPGGLQFGIPVPPEADSSGWHAAQFAGAAALDPATQVGIQAVGANGNDTPTGFFNTDFALVFEVNTLGYQKATIEFDWRTLGFLTNEFRAGFLVAPSPFSGPNDTADFRGGAYDWANWTELLSGSSNFWHPSNEGLPPGELLMLPGNVENVLVAFWSEEVTEKRSGKVDNVVVTLIPEPGTALLLGLGLVVLGARKGR